RPPTSRTPFRRAASSSCRSQPATRRPRRGSPRGVLQPPRAARFRDGLHEHVLHLAADLLGPGDVDVGEDVLALRIEAEGADGRVELDLAERLQEPGGVLDVAVDALEG